MESTRSPTAATSPPPHSRTQVRTAAAAPLRISRPGEVDPRHPRLSGEPDEPRLGKLTGVALPQAIGSLGEYDDRAALRRLVREAGELRCVGELGLGDAVDGQELAGLPVAQGDGAGLVEQQRVHVSGSLDRAPRHGQHVVLHQPVHSRDADGREQRADRGGDQADQQRHQDDHVLARAAVDGERLQRDRGAEEDDREAGQQDVQGDLVRRLLAVRALDERDHPVDEALARPGRDLHDDAVAEHPGPTGHRGAVASGLADHRGGLARDRGLVHAGDALDDVAVSGDGLTGHHDDDVAQPELRGGHLLLASVREPATGTGLGARLASVAAWALPRPSATASARFAKTTVSHSHTTTDQPKTLGSWTALTVAKTAPTSTTNITGDLTITRGSSLRNASGSEVSSWRGSSSPPETRVGVIVVLMTVPRRAVPVPARGRR